MNDNTRAADAREGRDVPDDSTKPVSTSARMCQRCGGALQAALHLPERIGQPAYDIFRCVGCGAVEWVARGSRNQA